MGYADSGGRGVEDLGGGGAAVEDPAVRVVGGWSRGVVVSQTVPLGGLLRVEVVFVVEGVAFGDPFYVVGEGFAAEAYVFKLG